MFACVIGIGAGGRSQGNNYENSGDSAGLHPWNETRITSVTVRSRAHRGAPTRWLALGGKSLPRAPTDLRAKSNFPNRIKLFLPVQSLSKKYSDFPKKRIALYPPLSCPSKEGRWPSSRTLGQDAVDASGAQDESAFLRTEKSFGPDASTPASSS